MLVCGVALQVPGAEEPAAAAIDGAAPLLPGLAGVMEAEQGVRLGEADLQTGMQISTVNRPSISLKGPVKVPQKPQCGPAPPLLELVFEQR